MTDIRANERAKIRDTVRSGFSTALKVDEFDDLGNFFALGGDSLGATSVLARIAEETGRSLSVEAFFQNPSVDALTDLIALTDLQSASGQSPSLDDLVDDLSDLDDDALARLLQ